MKCKTCGNQHITECDVLRCRIGELEAQLDEKPQALIDIGADDINEHLIKRAELAEKQLAAVRNAFAGMKFVSADKDNMEFNVKLTCWQKEALQAAMESK